MVRNLRLLVFPLVLVLAMLQVVPVQAQTRVSPSPVATTSASVKNQTGPHFFAGDEVVLTDNLQGDVYVAANTVRIENTIDGDLLVAGAQVTITGTVNQDVRAAAANVDVRGTVLGNMSVAAGTFTVDRQGAIGGSVVAATGNTDIYGRVTGNARLASSVVTIGGQLSQDLYVRSEQLRFSEGAQVGGDVSALTQQTAEIGEAVAFAGQRDLQEVPAQERNSRDFAQVVKASAAWVLLVGVMSLVGGSVMLALFPLVAEKASAMASSRPIASLGWGIGHLILTPVAGVLLLVTVIGVPLGLIVMLLYCLSLLLGGWVVALAIGQRLVPSPKTTYSVRLLQFGVGLVLLQIITLIPFLGWLVKVVAVVIGMGSLVILLKNALLGTEAAVVPTTPALTVLEPVVVPVTSSTKKTAVKASRKAVSKTTKKRTKTKRKTR